MRNPLNEIPPGGSGARNPYAPPPEAPGGEAAEGSPAWESSFSPGAFFRTFPEVLFFPAATFRAMLGRAGLGPAVLFVLIAASAPVLLNSLIFPGEIEKAVETMREQPGGAEMGEKMRLLTQISTPMLFAGGLLFTFVMLLVLSLLVHLCLMLLGSAKEPFDSTFRVMAYCDGATALFAMIPYAGPLAAFVWKFVCATIGLSERHGISRGRAFAAMALSFLALFLCCCGLLVFLGLFVAAR